MKKYARLINENTKQCEIGIGTNDEFYQSIGMQLQDVEEAYDNNWYLAGYAPSPTDEFKSAKIRFIRDKLLLSSDTNILPDRWAKMSTDEQELWSEYRNYLRDIPEQKEFPNIEVLSFEEWSNKDDSK